MKKLGALWLRKDKDGASYFSGSLEDLAQDIPVVVFKNNKKEQDNHPDYIVYRSEPQAEKKEKVATADQIPF
jgi:uncharacterized protein (DUF736 family)